jgi:hypothetical protein
MLSESIESQVLGSIDCHSASARRAGHGIVLRQFGKTDGIEVDGRVQLRQRLGCDNVTSLSVASSQSPTDSVDQEYAAPTGQARAVVQGNASSCR